jgi:hypothetical protein
MFTNLGSAIDEARYLKSETGKAHAVIQRPSGIMHVRRCVGRLERVLYSTKQDKSGGVVNV